MVESAAQNDIYISIIRRHTFDACTHDMCVTNTLPVELQKPTPTGHDGIRHFIGL